MKKIVSLILAIVLLLCLGIPAFAIDGTETAELGNAEEDVKNSFISIPFLADGYETDTLSSFVYSTYESDSDGEPVWIGVVYSDDEYVNCYIVKCKNGKYFIEGSGTSGNLGEGLQMLKEKFSVKDENIKLAYTMEGFYASMNGITDEMYRVGDRAYYNPEDKLVDKSYKLTEINRAGEAQLEFFAEYAESDRAKIMGNTNIFPPFDELIKPAFPVWGYFAIGGGVVLIAAVLFLVLKKKKKTNEE